jgi:DNA-binding XRE family transcriptional regulator
MNQDELREYLREVALRLIDRDMSAAEVAEVLDLPRQTVAAWEAHRTMGTY